MNHEGMRQTTDTATALEDLTAQDLMGEPGPAINLEASLSEVVDRFLAGPSRHLIVVDDDGRAVGVLDPRHLAKAHRVGPDHEPKIRVKDLGFGHWVAAHPDDDLRTCARMLIEHDLDAVPVIGPDFRVLGLVTAHDIARAVACAPSVPRVPGN